VVRRDALNLATDALWHRSDCLQRRQYQHYRTRKATGQGCGMSAVSERIVHRAPPPKMGIGNEGSKGFGAGFVGFVLRPGGNSNTFPYRGADGTSGDGHHLGLGSELSFGGTDRGS